MSKFTKERSQKAGLPPGTLIHIGERKREKTDISIFDYDEHKLEEKQIMNVDELFHFRDKPSVKWIDVDGIHQVDVLEKVGNCFGLHPLVMEDILNTSQRPKLEDYGDYIYIVAKMIYFNDHSDAIVTEQVSLILGKGFAISFQEKGGDVFNPIRERLRSGNGRIRKMGSDYLVYALLDAIVDNYFIILEKFGDKIELVEDELVARPEPKILQSIQHLKREMLFLHKSVWPLREVIGAFERGESYLVQDSTGIYLRDIYDHIVQAMDTIETFRDILSGMLDIYLSGISNRMNEVMKVLTIISTMFIPLTFLAGVYGMNFKYMPELEFRWSYPILWVIMLFIGYIMLVYFKKKKWI